MQQLAAQIVQEGPVQTDQGQRMNWKSIRFRDFVTLQRGFDLPKSQMDDGDVPVLGSQCVIGFHNEAKVEPPGVVTGRSGTLGLVQYTDQPYWPHNTALWVRDFKGNDPRFVYYKLQTLHLERFNGGVSVPTLNRNVLDTLPLEVPVLSEQKRIASILSAYDDLIENNRRRIQLLEQTARLLYKEWFVHLRFPGHEHVKIKDGVPEGWERKPLSALCTDIREPIHPKDVSPDVPYIGLEHIPRHSITLNSWGTAVEVSSGKFRFLEGDILFGKIRPYFHKVGFTLLDGITSSDAIVIRPTENLLYFYVLSLLASDEFVALASKTVREGSKMPRADWNFLLKSEFRIPSKAIWGLFNEKMSPICIQLRTLALHNRKLERSRDLLLPRLMNGKIAI